MKSILVVGGAALATALLSVSSAAAAVPKLVGTVGPGFTITLTQGGKKVTKLKAGKYTFVINDKSSMHSYGLDGPRGFAKDFTSVSFRPVLPDHRPDRERRAPTASRSRSAPAAPSPSPGSALRASPSRGVEHELELTWNDGYGGGIFLAFTDETSGTTSYGGGRYLIDTVKGADLGFDRENHTAVLDFNFAFNPSCSYDPRWACPLAPPANRLPIAVTAGEQHPQD